MNSKKPYGEGGKDQSFGAQDEKEQTGYVKKKKNKLKKTIYLQKLEKTIDNLRFFHEMFGEEIKVLGENYLEAARVAYRCAQHDQFITTTNSIDELHRLEDAQRKMLLKLKDKFGFELQMESRGGSSSRSPKKKQQNLEMNFQMRRGSNGEKNDQTNHLNKIGEIDRQLFHRGETLRKGAGIITHTPAFKASAQSPDSQKKQNSPKVHSSVGNIDDLKIPSPDFAVPLLKLSSEKRHPPISKGSSKRVDEVRFNDTEQSNRSFLSNGQKNFQNQPQHKLAAIVSPARVRPSAVLSPVKTELVSQLRTSQKNLLKTGVSAEETQSSNTGGGLSAWRENNKNISVIQPLNQDLKRKTAASIASSNGQSSFNRSQRMNQKSSIRSSALSTERKFATEKELILRAQKQVNESLKLVPKENTPSMINIHKKIVIATGNESELRNRSPYSTGIVQFRSNIKITTNQQPNNTVNIVAPLRQQIIQNIYLSDRKTYTSLKKRGGQEVTEPSLNFFPDVKRSSLDASIKQMNSISNVSAAEKNTSYKMSSLGLNITNKAQMNEEDEILYESLTTTIQNKESSKSPINPYIQQPILETKLVKSQKAHPFQVKTQPNKIQRLVIKDSVLQQAHFQSQRISPDPNSTSDNHHNYQGSIASKLSPKLTYGNLQRSNQLMNDYANQPFKDLEHQNTSHAKGGEIMSPNNIFSQSTTPSHSIPLHTKSKSISLQNDLLRKLRPTVFSPQLLSPLFQTPISSQATVQNQQVQS